MTVNTGNRHTQQPYEEQLAIKKFSNVPSIFGSMSLIVLFFGISDQLLFVIKIIISIIMVLKIY